MDASRIVRACKKVNMKAVTNIVNLIQKQEDIFNQVMMHDPSDIEPQQALELLLESIITGELKMIERPDLAIGPGTVVKHRRHKGIMIVREIPSTTEGLPTPIAVNVYHLGSLISDRVAHAIRSQADGAILTTAKLANLIPIQIISGKLDTPSFSVVDERGKLVATFKGQEAERINENHIMIAGKPYDLELVAPIAINTVAGIEEYDISLRAVMPGHSRMRSLQQRIIEQRELHDALAGNIIVQLYTMIRKLQRHLSNDHNMRSIFHANITDLLSVAYDGTTMIRCDSRMNRERFTGPPIIINRNAISGITEDHDNRLCNMGIGIPFRYRPTRVVDDADVGTIPDDLVTRLQHNVLLVFSIVNHDDSSEYPQMHLSGLYELGKPRGGGVTGYVQFPHYHWFNHGGTCWGTCPQRFNPGDVSSAAIARRESLAFKNYLGLIADTLDTINADSPTDVSPLGLPSLQTIITTVRGNGNIATEWRTTTDRSEQNRLDEDQYDRLTLGVNADTLRLGVTVTPLNISPAWRVEDSSDSIVIGSVTEDTPIVEGGMSDDSGSDQD